MGFKVASPLSFETIRQTPDVARQFQVGGADVCALLVEHMAGAFPIGNAPQSAAQLLGKRIGSRVKLTGCPLTGSVVASFT